MKRTALVAAIGPIHKLIEVGIDQSLDYADRSETTEVYINVYTIEGEDHHRQYGVLCADRDTAAYIRIEPLGSKCVYRLRVKKKSGKNKRKVK